MTRNNFNLVAPFYDTLGSIVFGNALLESQRTFLHCCPPSGHVLIAGGGSGRLVNDIPDTCAITYVEKSRVMLKAAQRNSSHPRVQFQCIDFFEFQSDTLYDVVICPFFLDCFNQENLKGAIDKIKSLTKPDGMLIVTDFQKGSISSPLVRCMHLFFKWTAHLDANELQPIHQHVVAGGYELLEEKFFYNKGVFSRIYRNL